MGIDKTRFYIQLWTKNEEHNIWKGANLSVSGSRVTLHFKYWKWTWKFPKVNCLYSHFAIIQIWIMLHYKWFSCWTGNGKGTIYAQVHMTRN